MEIDVVERGCGWPVEDSMYWVIPTSPNGVPMEHYLMDPLQAISSEIKIRKRGLTLIEVGGVTHIIDHVGSGPYPNAWDWFFEAKMHKFHQKIDINLPFKKLDLARSKYFMSHERVIPLNPAAWAIYKEFAKDNDALLLCAKHDPEHDIHWDFAGTETLAAANPNEAPLCASFLLSDIIKGLRVNEGDAEKRIHKVTRKIKSGKQYTGYSLDLDEEPQWGPGIFAWFPVSIMESVMYPGNDEDITEDVVQRLTDGGWANEIQFVELKK